MKFFSLMDPKITDFFFFLVIKTTKKIKIERKYRETSDIVHWPRLVLACHPASNLWCSFFSDLWLMFLQNSKFLEKLLKFSIFGKDSSLTISRRKRSQLPSFHHQLDHYHWALHQYVLGPSALNRLLNVRTLEKIFKWKKLVLGQNKEPDFFSYFSRTVRGAAQPSLW